MKKRDANHPFFQPHPIQGWVTFKVHPDAVKDLESYAAGYHDAAKTLAAKMHRSRHPPHFSGFPVLFLYRHALELYLKAVVYLGTQLITMRGGQEIKVDGLLKEHSLQRLVPPLEKVLEGLGWLKEFRSRGIRSFRDFRKLVGRIDQFDSGSYAFRYPVNTKGHRALPEAFFMNALGFAKSLDPILELLDTAIFAMNAEVEQYGDSLQDPGSR
jgi:hypothetical protein